MQCSNIRLLFALIEMDYPANSYTHLLLIIDAGSLQTRIKAVARGNNQHIVDGLAEFIFLNGTFEEYMGLNIPNIHDLLVNLHIILQRVPNFRIIDTAHDAYVLRKSGEVAKEIILSYMHSEDAFRYNWDDCIYWAMYAMNAGISRHCDNQFYVARSLQSVALADIKRRFELRTSNLFFIADHKFFPTYKRQCFVKLFIDFDLMPGGISDWHPLTPELRRSRAFQQYAESNGDIQRWTSSIDLKIRLGLI